MAEESENLLGQLAIEHGLITTDQLEKSLEVQRSGGNSPLGQVLKDLGYLDSVKLRFLEEHQTKSIRNSKTFQRPARADMLFGKLVQQRGFANARQVALARERKAILKSQGQRIELGQVMVEMGFLTGFQFGLLTSKRSAQVLFCTKCDLVQRVFAVKDGYRIRCEKCHGVMRAARDLEESKAQATWFHEDRAEFVGYLGKLAIKEGYLDQEQVVKALQHQAMEAPDKTLGDVFLELGFLDEKKLVDLRAEHDRSVAKQESRRKRKLRKSQFGEAAIRLELTDDEFVKAALAVQARKEKEGLRRRLGLVLVEQGDLTPYQFARILEAQGKRIGRCPDCANQYNIAEEMAEQAECPSCHKRLEIVDDPETLEIHEDLVVGPVNLAVLDLGDDLEDRDSGRFPADDTVRMATRALRRFYKEVGLDDHPDDSATPTTGP